MDDLRGLNQLDPTADVVEVLGAPIDFSTLGAISNGDRQAVIDMLEKVLAPVEDNVTHLRVRMEHSANRNRERPTTVRAILDFRGGAVRGHVTAESTRAAIDQLEHRLRSQLRHRSQRRKAQQHRGITSGPGEWRHGDRSTERPPYFPRPADEREVVRHKSVAPADSSLEEAIFDLEMMDYDFYLFVHLGSGRDAIIHRAPESEEVAYGAQFVRSAPDLGLDEQHGVTFHAESAPLCDLNTAIERLDVGHEPWVFFEDATSNRGHVLYRRYDGHYGLIVPLDAED